MRTRREGQEGRERGGEERRRGEEDKVEGSEGEVSARRKFRKCEMSKCTQVRQQGELVVQRLCTPVRGRRKRLFQQK